MSEPTVVVERHGAVAVLVLNRPAAANAIDPTMFTELAAAERAVAADPSIRVVVVTGAGRHFCAGVDLSAATVESPWKPGVRLGFDLVPQPLVAAINGAAMGGGCEQALACDFRIMSSTARIGLPEVQFGELPLGGGTARLARLVGVPVAKRMIMLGEPLDAREALACGLVDQVVEPEQVLPAAMELAGRLAELAPYAVQLAKHLVDRSVETDLAAALELERRMVPAMATPAQRLEARRAAAERSPVYRRLFGSGD